MTDTPTPEPEVQTADLATALLRAIADPGNTPYPNFKGERSVSEWSRDSVIFTLRDLGYVMEGVPPVRQVLADARQYSDQLVLTNLVARFFRVIILGAVIIPETPAAMDWLRDYIDGTHKVHGPIGKPMIWPGRLPSIVALLRAWGFQPTPTVPQYVSLRPGGVMAPLDMPDPQAPDPRSVAPISQGRESSMGQMLDQVSGGSGIMAVDRMTAIRAMSAAFDRGATHVADGFIVGNADRTEWRTWINGIPAWTSNFEDATRYARRQDAEDVHLDDEGVWRVVSYAEQRDLDDPAAAEA